MPISTSIALYFDKNVLRDKNGLYSFHDESY